MSDFARTALVLFLTVAPLGAIGASERFTHPESRLLRALLSCSTAFVLLAGTAVASDSFLDWIDVSPENFQLAAALIVLPHAFHLILSGSSIELGRAERHASYAWLIPLVVPLLVSPASVGATISYASRFGSGNAIAAAALVLGLTVAIMAGAARLTGGAASRAISVVNRFSGALLIAMAVELAVDGIKSI